MAKSPYDIEAAATFADAGRVALRVQAREVMRNLSGTREGDVESLHDMRVATRRLRAAMSVFGSLYHRRKFAGLEAEIAQVTDDLGSVRDADVMIDYLRSFAAGLPPAEKVGIDGLIDKLSADRDRDRAKLIKDLSRLEKSKFADDFAAMLGIDALEEEAAGG